MSKNGVIKLLSFFVFKGRYSFQILIKILLLLMISVGLLYALNTFSPGIDPGKYVKAGYLGIFFATLIGSATILLPAPNIPVIILGGALFNPIISGVVGGLGWGLGEITGYMVGRIDYEVAISTQSIKGRLEKVKKKIDKSATKVIFLAAIIPNPFFDVVGVAAGVMKISVMRFLIPCLLGKIICAIGLSLISNLII